MPQYAGQIEEFTAALIQNAGENARFSLASFGEVYALLAAGTGADALEYLRNLRYDAQASRIREGSPVHWSISKQCRARIMNFGAL